MQAIRGHLVYGEFKNSNKLPEVSLLFIITLHWQFQTILTSPCWGKMAPIQPPLLGPPLGLMPTIL